MPRPERQVDPAEGPVQRFAVELRALRERAGKLTYRELAERTGYSVSTLSDAAGGRRMPTLDVALAYAAACGGDQPEWEAAWHAATLAAAEETGASGTEHRAPYRGLRSYRAEDADLFFGRERLVTEVVKRVRAQPVTVVIGASGVGKSSLLAAGVVPALRARDDGDAPVLLLNPGPHPWADLLEQAPWAADGGPYGGGEALIVVDQFEELFTRCDAAEQATFVDGLLALSRRPDGRCRVILGVRADFYGHCAEHPGLVEALRGNQVLVGPMTADELREAISGPAAAAGLSVERALLSTAVTETRGRAGALPLLAHAMLETWRRRRGGVLTLVGFEAAGGLSGALAQTAEAAYGELGPERRRLAGELLLRLLTVDEDRVTIRHRADLGELVDGDPEAAAVLDRLAAARLITIEEDTVEIAHEALLTAWPRMRAWIDDDRDALREHRKITEAVRVWTESDGDPSTLASGARLEVMRSRAAYRPAALRLSLTESAFLQASDERARQLAAAVRRRTLRLRALTAVALVFALVAGVLAEVAREARTDAVQVRDDALSRQISLSAGSLRDTDPTLAAQLAIAGYRTAPTEQARSALIESSGDPAPARYLGHHGPTAMAASPDGRLVAVSDAADGTVRLFTGTGGRLVRGGTIPAGGRGVSVYALALTPDRRVLAVGDTTSAVTLWDVSEPRAPVRRAVVPPGPRAAVERLAVNPSGTELAAAGGHDVHRWDITEPGTPRRLPAVDSRAPTTTVAYAPGGRRLAYGTDSGDIELWDVHGDPERRATLSADGETVPAVSFSPDGRTLAAGAHDGHVRIWDVGSPRSREPDRVLDLFNVWVTTIAFSPDGRSFIAGSSDSTVRVLDTSTWSPVRTLRHPDVVTWAVFAEGGRSILSVATDGALRRWAAPALPRKLPSTIFDTSFSADGSRLAAFTTAGTALWDTRDAGSPRLLADALTERGDRPPLSGAGALSADGRLAAVGTDDGGVHLFDITDPDAPRRLARLGGGAGKQVKAVAFSPDGAVLAAGGYDGAIRLWNLAKPRRPRLTATLSDPGGTVLDLKWRPGGRYLAAGSADAHVYLYDVTRADRPRPRGRLGGMRGYVYGTAFAPDGGLLAVGGTDGAVQLWDVRDPARPRQLGRPTSGATGRIYALSFRPGGRILATTGTDGTVALWRVTGHGLVRTAEFAAAGDPLNTASFRPAGDMLVAGGADQTLRTWRTDEAPIIGALCRATGDPITRREWDTHLDPAPFKPPCPA